MSGHGSSYESDGDEDRLPHSVLSSTRARSGVRLPVIQEPPRAAASLDLVPDVQPRRPVLPPKTSSSNSHSHTGTSEADMNVSASERSPEKGTIATVISEAEQKVRDTARSVSSDELSPRPGDAAGLKHEASVIRHRAALRGGRRGTLRTAHELALQAFSTNHIPHVVGDEGEVKHKQLLAAYYVNGEARDGVDYLTQGRQPFLGGELFLMIGGRSERPDFEKWSPQKRSVFAAIRRTLWLFNILMVLGTLATFVYYVYWVVANYQLSYTTPSTQVNVQLNPSLNFPTITICQPFASDRAAPDFGDLGFCRQYVGPYDPFEDCMPSTNTIVVDDPQTGVAYNCISMNSDMNQSLSAVLPGGSYYSIDSNFKLANTEGETWGISLTLTPWGRNVTLADIQNSPIYANSGSVLLVLLKRSQRVTLAGVVTDEFIPSVSYLTPAGNANVADFWTIYNATYMYVSVSYSSLNVEIVQERVEYSVVNLLGDLAGMMGTLIGLDAINLAFWLQALLMKHLFVRSKQFDAKEDDEDPYSMEF